jgi:NAD(P)-dependent dehydrogenase (short-subunit alcohol dehydrogenase family)
MSSGQLEGKVAVVTGAGSGIGRAVALRFAAEGASVVVNDIVGATAEETVGQIMAVGGAAIWSAGDVCDGPYMDDVVALTVDTYGRLDIIDNNAGIAEAGKIISQDEDSFARVVGVNLTGTMHGMRSALAVMVPQGSGSIINTASRAGVAAATNLSAYGASKAAVINMTKSAAVEYGRYGIRANAICPGPIDTPSLRAYASDWGAYEAQLPMRRVGTAEDVAKLAVFLASDDSSFISGNAIFVDGAIHVMSAGPDIRPEDPNA